MEAHINPLHAPSWFLARNYKPQPESKDLVRELQIPRGELNAALDNLQIDYKLPISSDDADSAASVLEFARLVSERRASQQAPMSE